jgi:hypothetical protein
MDKTRIGRDFTVPECMAISFDLIPSSGARRQIIFC